MLPLVFSILVFFAVGCGALSGEDNAVRPEQLRQALQEGCGTAEVEKMLSWSLSADSTKTCSGPWEYYTEGEVRSERCVEWTGYNPRNCLRWEIRRGPPQGPFFTEPGLSLEAVKALELAPVKVDRYVPDIENLRCLTCEQVDLPSRQAADEAGELFADAEAVRGMAHCLQNATLRRHLLSLESWKPLLHRYLLFFELWGDQIDRQRFGSPYSYQYDDLIDAPMTIDGCGPQPIPTFATPIDGELPGEAVGSLIGCDRMTLAHVPPAVRLQEAKHCLAQLENVTMRMAWAGHTPTDKETVRQFLDAFRSVARDLFREQARDLGHMDNARELVPNQVSLMADWYSASINRFVLDHPEQYHSMFSTPNVEEQWPIKDYVFEEFSFLAGDLGSGLDPVERYDDLVSELIDAVSVDGQESAMTSALGRSRELRQQLALAIVAGENRLYGPPILLLLADTLAPDVARAEELSLIHDLACTFDGCDGATSVTPLSTFWELLAALPDEWELAQRVAVAGDLDGWGDVFRAIADNYEFFNRAVQSEFGDIGFDAPPSVCAVASYGGLLASFIRKAQARVDSFDSRGRFDPTHGRVIRMPLDAASRDEIIQVVNNRVTDLDAAVQRFGNSLVGQVNSIVSEMGTSASSDRLENLRRQKALRYEQLEQRLLGLQRSAEAQERDFGVNLNAHFENIKDAGDTGDYLETRPALEAQVSGSDARAVGPVRAAGLPDVAFQAITDLEAGQLLTVETMGQYSPTCALRKVKAVHPTRHPANQGAHVSVGAADSVTGPEGFFVSWGTDSYAAASHAEANNESVTKSFGIRGEVCMTTGPWGSMVGVEAKACAYAGVDFDWNDTTTDTETLGNETRTSASFNGGMRLPNTPIPSATVGSLLVVLTTPASSGRIRVVDIVTVQAPHTSILVPQAVDAYFVVNDLGTCNNLPGSNTLLAQLIREGLVPAPPTPSSTAPRSDPHIDLTAHVWTSQGALAGQFVAAMARVLTESRANDQLRIDQGVVLSSELSEFRSTARHNLEVALERCEECGIVTVEDLPAPLLSLFSMFVDKEVVRIERTVEIANVEHELELVRLELAGLEQDVANQESMGHLQSLASRWHAANLNTSELIDSVKDLAHVIDGYMVPMLRIWQPEVLEFIATDENVRDVASDLRAAVTLSSSFVSLAPDIRELATMVLGDVRDGALLESTPSTTFPVVAVGFTKPGSGHTSEWRQADEAAARHLWTAINNALNPEEADPSSMVATVTITPELIYSQSGESGVLPCDRTVPIVRRMRLHVVREFAIDNDALSAAERWLQLQVGPVQSFMASNGPELYDLENDNLAKFTSYIQYGSNNQAIADFRSRALPDDILGLSAVGTFHIDFEGLRRISTESGFGRRMGASELVLLMEIESQEDCVLDWVATCQ
jgi:hypothetical protein